jgi:hypothetical protein
MYRDLNKFLDVMMFSVFAYSFYLTFSNSWIAKIINQLQMQLYGDAKFSPVITIFFISFLPLLWAFRIKKILRKKINDN